MKALGVIPSRIGSTRLPGKPLADIKGRSLVERVWQQASQANCFERVIVATDSEQIVKLCDSFGAQAMMTSESHESGTDRVCEVANRLEAEGEKYDIITNIQGDLPFIAPELIARITKKLHESPREIGMTTAATPITSQEEFNRDSIVKIVLDKDNCALYFSRAKIPSPRDDNQARDQEKETQNNTPLGLMHFGIYSYRPSVLKMISQLEPVMLEKKEKLEQLRALYHGVKIVVDIVEPNLVHGNIEIDTPEDLKNANL